MTCPLLELRVSRPGQMLLPQVHQVVNEVRAGEGGGRKVRGRQSCQRAGWAVVLVTPIASSSRTLPHPPTFSHTLPHRCLRGPVSPGQLRSRRTAEVAGSTVMQRHLMLPDGASVGVWWLPCARVCGTGSSCCLKAEAAGVHTLLLLLLLQRPMCCCPREWL